MNGFENFLRCCRGVQFREDATVSAGANGIPDGAPRGNSEHQRRLAHRLGAIDRLLAVGRVPERDVEDVRAVGAGRDLVGRGRVGAQPAIVVTK